jgi:hypothetical protein
MRKTGPPAGETVKITPCPDQAGRIANQGQFGALLRVLSLCGGREVAVRIIQGQNGPVRPPGGVFRERSSR